MTGKLWTAAKWIRHFIHNHPEYKHDSAVSKHINYDLVRAVEKITKGVDRDNGLGAELLGQYGTDSSGTSTPTSPRKTEITNSKMNGVGIRGLDL